MIFSGKPVTTFPDHALTAREVRKRQKKKLVNYPTSGVFDYV
jgi:hypothetical protein